MDLPANHAPAPDWRDNVAFEARSFTLKQITPALLHSLGVQAQASPRRRANLNLHDELTDPIQRLAIAMEPATYVRPHRHQHTWELLFPLKGRFIVLCFDESGTLTERTVLGEASRVVEIPGSTWHAVLSLDSGAVIFEVKHGPYRPIAETDYAHWSPAAGDAAAAALNDWYATAQLGARWPAQDD